jgi:hypothetical protein
MVEDMRQGFYPKTQRLKPGTEREDSEKSLPSMQFSPQSSIDIPAPDGHKTVKMQWLFGRICGRHNKYAHR